MASGTTMPGRSGGRGRAQEASKNKMHAMRKPADEVRALREELERVRHELRDATERLRDAEAQLVQAGRLSALGQLVAGVAHEMNNPLTSVMGYAQLVHQQLVRRPELAEQARDLLPDVGHIVSEAGRAARIVRNLLLFARRHTAAHSFQDIVFLSDQVVELRSHDLRLNGIEIKTSFAPDLPAVLADGSQIQQVLLNLLLNAEQAVAKSATRHIDLTVRAEPGCGTVLIEVRDSGEGIDAESLGRVFDPFYTTRSTGEGTGLGLSIAWNIVREHGGQIWAESEPHVRTSFFVRLPASDDQAEAGSRGGVVVLHNDERIRATIAATFTGWGFRARAFDALAAVLTEGGSAPALVIADAAAVRQDPAQWERAWERWGDRTGLIGVSLSPGEDPAELRLRGRAAAIIEPDADLCALRRALEAARRTNQAPDQDRL
jgi:signal transduction histidine kinase